MDNRLLPPKDQFRPDREPPRAIEPRTYAYEPQACLPSSARPTWRGPWMCAGVRDRPVRRLLAWLLTLSASASVAGRPCARQPPPSRTLRRHQLPYLADCDPVDRVNLTLIRTTLMAAVVALTIALIGCSRGNDAVGMPSEPGATPPGASASAAGQFNEADVMFARQMILHPRAGGGHERHGAVQNRRAPRSHGARPADQSHPAAGYRPTEEQLARCLAASRLTTAVSITAATAR